MGLISSYYINSSSFATATAIFTDSGLTTLATDGFYSMEGIVREQVSGVLQQSADCVDCAPLCGGDTITVIGAEGTYTYSAYVGDDFGAVRVEVNTLNSACGFEASTGSTTTNAISTRNLGLLANPQSWIYTYIGSDTEFNVFSDNYPNYDYAEGEWVQDGVATIGTASSYDFTNSIYHGGGVMHIKKLSTTDNIVNVEVQAPVVGLQNQANFTIKIDCVRDLPGFNSSQAPQATVSSACNDVATGVYYAQTVNGTDPTVTGEQATVGLYDFVFNDTYGFTPVSDGYFKIDAGYMRVIDGVVTEIAECGGA